MARVWGEKPSKPAQTLLRDDGSGQSVRVTYALNFSASRAAHHPFVSNVKYTGSIPNWQTQSAKPRTAFNGFFNFLNTNNGKATR